jgi:hypothetical protein
MLLGKKYLLYLDILGFEELAEEIAKNKRIEARRVRSVFIETIKERVDGLEAKGVISGKNYSGSDDWLLVVDSLDLVYKTIFEVLDHNTGYFGYERIPMEIGIGVAEYDRWTEFEGPKLFIEGSTINALKPNIIGCYHSWYRQKNERLKTSFIVVTQSAYEDLDPLDKKTCQRIEYEQMEGNHRQRVITFFVLDLNQAQRRGKLFKFLDAIGQAGSKIYDRIDCLYVPPVEYDEIRKILAEKRIVFITGTPEFGKTYTAVRLLWEYFNEDYIPIWWEGEEEPERREMRRSLEDIERTLKPHHVVYFEDPFGKVEYESRSILEREIGTIIDCVHNVGDVFVIITSREEVFKKFLREHLSSMEIRKFERKLNIKKPSYSLQKRREILLNWAESRNCKWLADYHLKEFVLQEIKSGVKLPTPMNIKDFVISTVRVSDERSLAQKIEEKSEETARVFAKEIENMTDDKILFLSFPFIAAFDVTLVEREYGHLVRALRIEHAWSFQRVLEWFKDDKIDASIDTTGRRQISFSHASYSEALPYILAEDGQPSRISESIFSKVLLELSKDHARDVASVVAHYSDKLPKEERDIILLELLKHNDAIWAVARAVVSNFELVSHEVQKRLFEVSEKDNNAWAIVWRVITDFGNFPNNAEMMLRKLATQPIAAGAVAWYVVEYRKILPGNVSDYLFSELSKRDEAAIALVFAMNNYFRKCPPHLRPLLTQILTKLSHSGIAKNRHRATRVAPFSHRRRAVAILEKLLK